MELITFSDWVMITYHGMYFAVQLTMSADAQKSGTSPTTNSNAK